MVETIGLLAPAANTPIAAPRVRPTGRINLNPRQEQAIKAQEEELARIKQLRSLNSRYSNPRNPELVRDIEAQRQLGLKSTAAQDYMKQVAAERAAEAPIPTPSPDAALKRGLIGGEAVAQDRSQGNLLSGLLGDIDYEGILNQLVKTFQRPEMLTPGVNALTSFGMSGAALNQAEMAGAAAEQERMDKFAMEQLKNAPGAPTFNSTQTELFQSVSQGSQILTSLQRAKEILVQSKITGAGPGAIEVGKNIIKAFGIDPGVGGRKEYEQKVAELKAYVSGQRVFGREMNKQELKILNTLASNPGMFNSNSELMGQLDAFIRRVNTAVGTNRRILEQQGFGQASRYINEPITSVFRD